MRAGVYPNAGCLGRPWLLRLSSSQMESKCYSEQPVLCRGTACTAAPLQRAVCWPPCVPGSEWQAALCVRQSVQQSVQGSWQVCAGTEGQLLFLLPG